MSQQEFILEIALNLEKDLKMEISSLLDLNDQAFSLKRLYKNLYLLRIGKECNVKYLEFSVIIKNVYSVLAESNDLENLLKSVVPVPQFYLEVIPRNRTLDKSSVARLWESMHGIKGDVVHPSKKYFLFHFEGKYYLTEKFLETQRRACLRRAPKYRPFKRSGILNSELARLMVNLGKVLPGKSVLDPFCGSGSILIEAYFNGAKEIVGIDIDPKMIEGAKLNLEFFGIDLARVKLLQGDCKELLKSFPENSFDAVVTDPPYGRSTKATDEIPRLLKACFTESLRIIRPGGRLVFVVPKELELNRVLPEEAKVIYTSEFYVHKSLTRRLVVVEK